MGPPSGSSAPTGDFVTVRDEIMILFPSYDSINLTGIAVWNETNGGQVNVSRTDVYRRLHSI
jgi:hypothetical protein